MNRRSRLPFAILVLALSGAISMPLAQGGPDIPPMVKDAPYRSARSMLTRNGWQPVKIVGANRCSDARCAGFPEVIFCSGVGRAVCLYAWHKADAFLLVHAWGEGDQLFDSAQLCARIDYTRQGGTDCVSYARARPAESQAAGYIQPVTPRGRVSGFFDLAYLKSEGRQHLGVDLPSPAGTKVVSPVDGKVVLNRTAGVEPSLAFLIIADTATGAEHVLGHIESALRPGDTARRGAPVGMVKDWGGNSHVHWGLNSRQVPRAVQSGPGGDWGWGRAPASASEDQARARGWINLNALSSADITRTTPKPKVDLPPSLTPISGATTNDCSISLDQRRTLIVGYDTPTETRFGINGQIYKFFQRDGRYNAATGAYAYRSKDGETSIRRQPLRKISTPSIDLVLSSITTTVNGQTSTIQAYHWCPPGD